MSTYLLFLRVKEIVEADNIFVWAYVNSQL